MGWKALRTHFGIDAGYIVHVTRRGVCIGSPLMTEIITICPDGSVVNRGGRYGYAAVEELTQYHDALEAAPAKVRELLATKDEFQASIPVYTVIDGTVVEKYCEVFGWPNVTHDGALMFEHMFFTDRNMAVARAKGTAEYSLSLAREELKKATAEVERLQSTVLRREAALAKLHTDHPGISSFYSPHHHA
ncbi:MAG: hypothetical protein BWY57_00620 [Betaproteobacteria bacterium ADurb.Bin341]|nr:MAG: hypothetical protein BWY57_00620 [Betaproteobacteria bacterium ADurb.Bin341]